MSGLLPLVVRTTVSLAIVLAFIGAAYVVVRRRATGGGSRRRTVTRPIEVVARAGLARGATAVALRFGDRVVMVGVSEQAGTTVLAEIDGARWDELHPADEQLVPTPVPARGASRSAAAAPGSNPVGAARPGFFDALRDATSRRA